MEGYRRERCSTRPQKLGPGVRGFMARLEIENGGGRREFAVTGIVTIGRQKDSSVHIDEPAVSRLHARIYHDGQAWNLEDLDSRTGTKLNGKRLSKSGILTNGDLFIIGKTRVRFSMEMEPLPSDSQEKNSGKWVRKQGGTPFPMRMQMYFVLVVLGLLSTVGFRFAFLWIFDNHLS